MDLISVKNTLSSVIFADLSEFWSKLDYLKALKIFKMAAIF